MWRARRARLEAIGVFAVEGRVSLAADGRAWSAGLRWEQRGPFFRLWLKGPLGQGIAMLESRPGHAVLRTAKNERFVAASAESLLAERVGWRLPVAGLRHWLLGAPAPGDGPAAIELDEAGRLASLVQWGWRLRYRRYEVFDGEDLPARIDVESDRARGRLALGRWRLGIGG